MAEFHGAMESVDHAGGPARRHPHAVLALAILSLFTMLSYGDRMLIVLMVDPIRADLGVNDVQVSLLTGVAFALCFGLSSIPLSWAADRYSRRWVIYGGVTIWSLATAACGLANTFGELFMARFFVGIGEAALAPAAFALIPDIFPRNQVARATGVIAAAGGAGGGLVMMIGGYLITWAQGAGRLSVPLVGDVSPWQLVFLVFGAPGVLLALLTFMLPAIQPSHDATSAPQAEREPGFMQWLMANWQFLAGISLGCAALGAIGYGVAAWTPTYFSRVLGMDMAHIGMGLGLVTMPMGFIGFVGGGVVIDWLAARRISNPSYRYIMVMSTLATVMAVMAFMVAKSFWVALAFLGVFHLAIPYNGVMVVALQNGAPAAYRGRVIAVGTTIAQLVGLTVGPTAMALFTEQVFADHKMIGQAMAAVTATCGLFALVALALSWRAARRTIEREQGAIAAGSRGMAELDELATVL